MRKNGIKNTRINGEVQKELSDAGFTNISFEILYDIVIGWTDEGEIDSISIDGKTDFEKGDIFKKDVPIVITYHMMEEDDPNKPVETPAPEVENKVEDNIEDKEEEVEGPVYYSSNTRDEAKNGNSGQFAYVDRGKNYWTYYIIDFDEGYVYRFMEGNGEESCDRVKIVSGDLNSGLKITYHDGGDEWSETLHFKYENRPDRLIMVDHNHYEWEYYAEGLDDALKIKNKKTIIDR